MMERREISIARLKRSGLALAFTFLFIAEGMSQDIQRSCQARYWITPQSISGDSVKTAEFSAHGRCGIAVPNRCRIRAYERISACVNLHWIGRNDRYKPAECTESKNVHRYPFVRLEKELSELACRHFGVQGELIVTVKVRITGHPGCGGPRPRSGINPRSHDTIAIDEDYKFNCAKAPTTIKKIPKVRPVD